MPKEEERKWRRDARRARNRESARISRARVQNRLKELEEEVELWKRKYSELLQSAEGRKIDNNDREVEHPSSSLKPDIVTSNDGIEIKNDFIEFPSSSPKPEKVTSSPVENVTFSGLGDEEGNSIK